MKIRIEGAEKYQANMNRRAESIRSDMHTATRKALAYVHSTVPPYPAERPGQTYIRKVSAGIGGSITTEVKPLGASVVGIIGSNKDYAPWVISDRAVGGRGPQAWMHVGRWWTLQGIVHKAWDQVVNIYREHFRKSLQ